jgi:hypothetical protein
VIAARVRLEMQALLMSGSLVLVASMTASPALAACKAGITLPAAVSAARQEAASHGFRTDQMEVIADEHNVNWNMYLKSGPPGFDPLPSELTERLRGRRFWVISFQRKSEPGFVIVGGGLSVFVDRCSGQVISSLPSA